MLLGVWWARRFTRPLTDITEAMDRLEDDTLDIENVRTLIRADARHPGVTLDWHSDLLPEAADQPPADTVQPELADYLADAERGWIEQTLHRHAGRIGETAKALGISRKNLWEKMKKLGIDRPAS